METKTFAISNGNTVEIDFNSYTGDYVMHNYTGTAIYGMGRYKTMEDAVAKMHKLIKMWGGFTATEI
jgi:hypothetical protein